MPKLGACLPKLGAWHPKPAVFENFPFELKGPSALPIENLKPFAWSHLPLALRITPGQNLLLELKYDAHHIDPAETARLLDILCRLLTALWQHLKDHPEVPLEDLVAPFPRTLAPKPWPLAEHVVPWPGVSTEHSLVHRFREVAARYPDHLAIETPARGWTYQILCQRAQDVAAGLHNLGGTPGSRVGLLCEHNFSAIVALLGSLFAGKVYVPLDPNHPVERLRWMLQDSAAELLLTDAANHPLARQLSAPGCPAVTLAEVANHRAPRPSPSRPTAEHLAYILYTSGSTGQPKGVLHSHRTVLGHIRTYCQGLGITLGDRLSWISSYTFDGAVMDLFGALLSGATLIPLHVNQQGLPATARRLRQQRITLLHTPPTIFRYLAAELSEWQALPFRIPYTPHPTSSLHTVVLGGEEVHCGDVELSRRLAPRRLINGFGPTESTLALQALVDLATPPNSTRVPIGRAVEGVDVLLLDAWGQPQEIYGEIALRSPSLALGYWRRPGLTAQSFIPDPEKEGGRLYRTGDLARRRIDGQLEFIGRLGYQLKVRGMRIEPGEVESRLREHPEIKEAVVTLARDDDSLVAHVVPINGNPPDGHALRRYLKSLLPAPMIPRTFISMRALPSTLHGKLDRRALSREPTQVFQAQAAVMPRNRREFIITALFEEVLETGPLGMDDDFFELGGHSLKALRSLARISEHFGRELSPATLIQAPTVARMAAILEGVTVESAHLAAIRTTGSRTPFFYVVPRPADLLGLAPLIRHLPADQPFYVLEPPTEHSASVAVTIESLAERYLESVRRAVPHGPYALGGYCYGGLVAYEMARQLRFAGEEVSLLALVESHLPNSMCPVAERRSLLERLVDGGRRHQNAMARLNGWRRLGYLVARLRARVETSRQFLIALGLSVLWRPVRPLVANGWCQLPQALADLRVLNRHRAHDFSPAPYEGPLLLVRSSESIPGYELDPEMGWGDLTTSLALVEIHSSHEGVHQEPGVRSLADALFKQSITGRLPPQAAELNMDSGSATQP